VKISSSLYETILPMVLRAIELHPHPASELALTLFFTAQVKTQVESQISQVATLKHL